MASAPTIVAQFGDAFVYSSDLPLLNAPNWLNDNLVTFFSTAAVNSAGGCGFIDPSVASFMMHQLDPLDEDYVDEAKQFIATVLPDAGSAFTIYVPVNSSFNSFGLQVGDGVHWSLLQVVYTPSSERSVVECFHYDSSGGSGNGVAAGKFVNKFLDILVVTRTIKSRPPTGVGTSGALGDGGVFDFPVSKQSDSWSCGWYTLTFLRMMLNGGSGGGLDLGKVNEEGEVEVTKRIMGEYIEKYGV
jgi:hypothetical protein